MENSSTRDGKTLKCPRCQTPLQTILAEHIEVDTCPGCLGIWVDWIEEKDLIGMKPEVFSIDELKRLRQQYEPLGRIEEVRYLPCPVCKELMHRKNWGSHSGVIVDKCSEHGSWYDEGELQKIREFVALGGVEFEKLKYVDKGLGRLESRLTQEVSRVDRKITSACRWARFWSMIGF